MSLQFLSGWKKLIIFLSLLIVKHSVTKAPTNEILEAKIIPWTSTIAGKMQHTILLTGQQCLGPRSWLEKCLGYHCWLEKILYHCWLGKKLWIHVHFLLPCCFSSCLLLFSWSYSLVCAEISKTPLTILAHWQNSFQIPFQNQKQLLRQMCFRTGCVQALRTKQFLLKKS